MPSAATLGDLHEIIHIALEWNDDHLHLFTIGKRQFGNPDFDADGDENEVTLREAFSRRTRLSYVYDLGDHWQHEITLEATRQSDPTTTYPSCTGGRGDPGRGLDRRRTHSTPSTRQRSTTDSVA